MKRILLVCMGNICRSPMAEGVLRGRVAAAGLSAQFEFDSAGTLDAHANEPPDPRAQRVAAAHGYDISHLRARQVRSDDFVRFDLLLAMDRNNLAALQRMTPSAAQDKLRLFMSLADTASAEDVPDPYYGSLAGFERVLALCEAAASGLLRE
jgi:protein-tyrosine phosphatase